MELRATETKGFGADVVILCPGLQAELTEKRIHCIF